jgi:uncharacterized membrane protein YeaQ/YmgE (transglycosylase-associated protein family)
VDLPDWFVSQAGVEQERVTMLDFIAWLVVGAVIGWIASMIMGAQAQRVLLLNVGVGVAGAVLAGLVLMPLLGLGNLVEEGLSLPSLLIALLGAVMLLALANLVRRGTVQ